MWFSVVCTLIDDIRHHSDQNVVRLVSPQQILTTVMPNIVVDKSEDNAKRWKLNSSGEVEKNEWNRKDKNRYLFR